VSLRGYVVSDFAADGFALLRGDRIFIPGSGASEHLRGLTVGGAVLKSTRGSKGNTGADTEADPDAGAAVGRQGGGGREKQRDF
jgi:hypothetical protein